MTTIIVPFSAACGHRSIPWRRIAGIFFLTNAEGLNDLYLDSLPSERQHHNCSACRRFIETYGALVAIAEDGETVPAMWNPQGVPEFYHAAFAAMNAKVKRARVMSTFLTKQAT